MSATWRKDTLISMYNNKGGIKITQPILLLSWWILHWNYERIIKQNLRQI